ncbi:MAG: type II secretion system minor pseudopilin GspK, partial [Proteobacteria bacterium]|nr:type II secretion system minor pseudopilin GspK [Pseudomonadota bacterium]
FRDQAIQVAVGSEGWVGQILREDLASTNNDHLDEIWATEIPALPIDSAAVQGTVWGRIEDLQGRFNVNNLIGGNGRTDPAALEQFRRLLAALELDPRFAALAADWLDADQNEAIPDGAEDPLYSGFTPAYRTADRRISNVSELAALDGMDRASFDVLQPHIAALPGRTAVNVNTASVPVLQSLGPNIDRPTAEGLVQQREGGGFVDFSTDFAPFVEPDLVPWIAETSSFFQLKAIVQIDTVRVTLFTVLHRNGTSGEVVPILRSLGTT